MKKAIRSFLLFISQEALWPFVIAALLLLLSGIFQKVHASQVRVSGRLSPSDYLFGSQEQHGDPVFDNYKVVDLSATIGVGSDCGKISFDATLRNTLSKMINEKYFAQVGQDILGGIPMLTLCYMSPTWCSIVKHAQVNANFLSQMRLNQCSLIDKYVDSRVEDFYQERQTCVHRAIDSNGGNMDAAMESCGGNNLWNTDLANWAGSKNGEKTGTNRLIDSSANWARMNGSESKGSLDLLKSLVGDTVVSKGSISVEYGPRNSPLTPRTYLQSLEKSTYEKLCERIMRKVGDGDNQTPVDQIVSDSELKDLSMNSDQWLVDRQTLRALAAMNPSQRNRACKKLSDAAAMTVFSTDVNRSLDMLTTLAQNPNLPPQRKEEIQEKRRALKEQIELTVDLQKQRSEPLNQVLSQIQEEGNRLQSETTAQGLSSDASAESNQRNDDTYRDCSDWVFCKPEAR